jgi:hypothetical protein
MAGIVMRSPIGRFTNVCYDLTRRGKLVKSKSATARAARWRLAPKEPDLI